MPTDTNVNTLIINKLTKAQYETATKSSTELYMVTDEDILPSQTGNNGKFLTTDGTNTSWADIPDSAIPDNVTIDLNDSDEMQTIGIIDQKTSNVNKIWTGTKAEYDAILVKDPNTTYRTTDEDESVIYENNYHIGQIFKSLLPLDTYGLHLLDGTLLDNNGVYSDFVSYIAGLYTADPTAAYFTDETSWQNSVTTYGVCGKFVYDSTNNTVRLPKVTGFIEGTIDSTALGDLVEAGLPNITGNPAGFLTSATGTPTGAFTGNTTFGNGNPTSGSASRSANFDASKSNSIYGNSTTVQPQSIKAYVYIVVANSYQTPVGMSLGKLATTSLDNLNITGKNVANWSSNVSNCITKIPQDIKLEINSSGKAVLKAGSKVIRPNGFETDGTTPKYDEIILDADLTFAFGSTQTGQYMLCIDSATGPGWAAASAAASGTSTSSTTSFYYRTNDNKIYYQNNSSGSAWSFPIALVTLASGVGSIDQVFNGFGFIGSIVYALPGIKGQAPNGRNTDGSLNNNEISISNVITDQAGSYNAYLIVSNNAIYFYGDTVTTYRYDENRLYDDYASVYVPTDRFVAGRMIQNSGVVSSIITKQTFRSLDCNDSDLISHWAMPSAKYIDLTLAASGTTYTAPADGYVAFSKLTTAALQNITIDCNNIRAFTWGSHADINIFSWLPVKKGDIFTVIYTAAGATSYFRFIYAEGAK